MMIDITLQVTPDMLSSAWENTSKSLVGHLGTHFDVMDKEFPLEYTELEAVVFDVSSIRGRDIDEKDINLDLVKKNMFVAFHTAFINEVEYGTSEYFKTHPQLSNRLIDALLDKNISIIGIDAGGIRRGKEHTPADQKCADRGVFVIENLCDLESVLAVNSKFIASTYPMRVSGITGLPCRVIAKLD